MTGETTNSAPAESADAHLATDIDNPANLNFEEPEEEKATDETSEAPTDTNSETDEGEPQEAADTEQASEDDAENRNDGIRQGSTRRQG